MTDRIRLFYEIQGGRFHLNWFLINVIALFPFAGLWIWGLGNNDMRFLWSACFFLLLGILLIVVTRWTCHEYLDDKEDWEQDVADGCADYRDKPNLFLTVLVLVLAILCIISSIGSTYFGIYKTIEDNEVAYRYKDGKVISEKLQPGGYFKPFWIEIKSEPQD